MKGSRRLVSGVPSDRCPSWIWLVALVTAAPLGRPGDSPRTHPGVRSDGAAVAAPSSRDRSEQGASVPAPEVFCRPKVNSLGCVPSLTWTGGPSASHASDFHLRASNVVSGSLGTLLYGVTGRDALPFHGGTLCLHGPIRPMHPQDSGGPRRVKDCSGGYSFDFNGHIASGEDPHLVVGTEVWAQYWSRDAASPGGVGLTDALHFTIGP